LLHFIWMFIVGILVGIIAKLIYPGAAHMGIILTGSSVSSGLSLEDSSLACSISPQRAPRSILRAS